MNGFGRVDSASVSEIDHLASKECARLSKRE